MFFINLPTEMMMHDIAYLLTSYWKRVRFNYLHLEKASLQR